MRREQFDTPGKARLNLRLREGRIELATTDGTTTEVELDARGDEDAQRLVEEARIERRGDEVLVDVGKRSGGFFGFLRDYDVTLTVRAPHGTDVRLDTASADTEARGRWGSFEAKTASGDFEAEDVGGDLDAKTASGDVEVRSVGGDAAVYTASGNVELGSVVGQTTVKTASGDVEIRDAGIGVNAATASGDVSIDAMAEGAATLQSASGDIRIGIRQGSSVWVDARAMSGDTRSELDLDDAPPADDGAPLVEVRATTMSGDITISRAPARAAA
jgi:hypothetical protein